MRARQQMGQPRAAPEFADIHCATQIGTRQIFVMLSAKPPPPAQATGVAPWTAHALAIEDIQEMIVAPTTQPHP